MIGMSDSDSSLPTQDYGGKAYWDDRYSSDTEPFDW